MRYCLWFLKTTCRHFSSKPLLTFKDINHFGRLDIKCPKISTIVRPINPHEVPNGDMAFINVMEGEYPINQSDKGLLQKVIDVGYCNKDHVLKIRQRDGTSFDGKLLIEIPHNYNLDVESYTASIEETEGNSMKVLCHKDCVLGKIKAGMVDIIAHGSLTCKNLLGNGKIFVENSCTFKKIQSKQLDITSNGDIEISSCYSPSLKCSSTQGHIDIGSLHGSSDITTSTGDLSINTLDGNLNAKSDSGNIEITIEQCGNVSVESYDGSIDIGLGESVSTFIESTGVEVDVPEDLLFDGMKRVFSTGTQHFEGKLGSAIGSINILTTNGVIGFQRKNWFSKFKIDLD